MQYPIRSGLNLAMIDYMMHSIEPFIHKNLTLFNLDAQSQWVAQALRDREVGCALITDLRGFLVGIVTDRDFATRWATHLGSEDVPISKLMSTEVVQADETASLTDVISLMEGHGIRRIPITSHETGQQDLRPVGIVTLDDLIVSGVIAPHHLARIVHRQISKRLALLSEASKSRKSQRRSEARMHQTLDRFYAYLTQVTGLNSEIVPQVSDFLLGALVMRITMTAGAHFIAQLPKLIQSSLLVLPPGPDRRITEDWIISELVSRFQMTEKFARTVFIHFLAGLQNMIDPGMIRHLKSQLPESFRAYFPLDEVKISRMDDKAALSCQTIMTLTSPAFKEGEGIPREFTGEGADISPPLQWVYPPEGTKEFALICEDPHPSLETPWVHWIIYGIPGSVNALPDGIIEALNLEVPIRARQGKNTWGTIGYRGPMPPVGDPSHRYLFRLFALDQEISLAAGATRAHLAGEMRGHILMEAFLTGQYQRTAMKKAV